MSALAYLAGVFFGLFGIALIVELVFLRKVKQPNKQYISVSITYIVSAYFAAHAKDIGAGPQFAEAYLEFGVAASLLIFVYFVLHSMNIKVG